MKARLVASPFETPQARLLRVRVNISRWRKM